MSDATHARLTKLSTLPDAYIDPEGARGLGPIEDGYVVLGHYLNAPTVGSLFQMTRYNSNGVEAIGIFRTSPVVAVREQDGATVFDTANSTYKLTPL